MSTQVQYRRGTEAQNNAFTGALAEITVDTTNWNLRIHDGVTAGGFSLITASSTSTLSNKTYLGTSLSVSGNVTGANVNGTFYGAGTGLTSIPGANVTGTVANATYATSAGTVTTAAQGNITSVGTLTSLSVSGNIVGSDITLSGNTIYSTSSTLTIDPSTTGVGGTVVIAGNLNVTGTTTTYDSTTVTINDLLFTVANNASTAASANGGGIEVGPVGASYASWTYDQLNSRWSTALGIGATGNITGGGLVGTLYTNSVINTGANATGNIGSATTYFNTVFAKATSAQYADLAEKYTADADYEPGTVVVFGGSAEVTASNKDADKCVVGVVSTNPSYIMNAGLESQHVVTIALIGRVPTKVVGPVQRGDFLVSAPNGHAQACATPAIGTVIGKAIEDFTGESGVIEILVNNH